jgi:hypothetical protein
MVAVKMAYKDMIDLSEADMKFSHLELSSLTAVYQKKPLMRTDHMSGWVSF